MKHINTHIQSCKHTLAHMHMHRYYKGSGPKISLNLYGAIGSFDSQEMASVGWTASMENTAEGTICCRVDYRHNDATFVLSATGKKTEIGGKKFTF